MSDNLNKQYVGPMAPVTTSTDTNQYMSYQGTVKTVIANGFVACKPLQAAQENKSSVFSSWEIKNPLPELEIIFADKQGEYVPGANIYVRPFLDPPSWIKDVFTFNGKEVILVPKEFIVGYKFLDEKKPEAVSIPYVTFPQVQYPSQPYYPVTGTGTHPGNVALSITWDNVRLQQQAVSRTDLTGVDGLIEYFKNKKNV